MEFQIKHCSGKSRGKPRIAATLKKILALTISSIIPIAFAAENEAKETGEIVLPDLELLEFLGQFETDNGEWIDPGSLLTEDFEDFLRVAEDSNPTTDTNNGTNEPQ